MTSLSWTVWDDCWKQLPYSVFYNILQFIDSIDIRRHFKLRPRKLILPENYKNVLDKHFLCKKDGYLANYNTISKTLHVLSYYFIDNEDISDIIFSHKSYTNLEFNGVRNGSTFFKNINDVHTETDNRYLYFSKTIYFIQKGVKTDVMISYKPVQNIENI